MTMTHYNPWRLGMLTEHITVALTAIEKLDKSKRYVVATNALLTEQHNITEENTEVDWEEFNKKHEDSPVALHVTPTDSIFMCAEEKGSNKDWKWCKFGYTTSKDITDDEFKQKIQHEGKVLVVTSVLCGGYRRFSNGAVEEVGCNKEAWDFEDEDKTFDIVNDISGYIDEGFNTASVIDEFYSGLEYVVKNMEDIQGLDHASQVKLVRMGYECLSESMGLYAHALRSIAERGSTSIIVSSIDA